jgi:crotonobetainyl-CoA:carnitine CoA-transferase CaiB-like acyl-CoA transferase
MMRQIFEGINILDFSLAGVGPIPVSWMGSYGATVIHIQVHHHPDVTSASIPYKGGWGMDYSWWNADYNSSKLSLSLDLNFDRGKEIAAQLVSKWPVDILVESFVPGVMEKWGMNYEKVKEIKPDIIYFSTSQTGQTGPDSKLHGYGPISAALSGFVHVSGWPDRGPAPPFGAYGDWINVPMAASILIAALDFRRRTGKVQFIDLSQVEGALHFMAPPIMDFLINGRIMGRTANRYPYAVPHNAYQCRGEDRWVAIAVFNDAEWKSLCDAMEKPKWKKDKKYSGFNERKKHEEEVDLMIGEWTKTRSAEEVESLLQKAGIAAGVVESTRDLFDDKQLKHRHHFRILDHPKMGPTHFDSHPFRLSKCPDKMKTAPLYGQDNRHILNEILKMTDDDISDLLAEGVLTAGE